MQNRHFLSETLCNSKIFKASVIFAFAQMYQLRLKLSLFTLGTKIDDNLFGDKHCHRKDAKTKIGGLGDFQPESQRNIKKANKMEAFPLRCEISIFC